MTPPILIAVDPRRDDSAPLALGLRLARIADAPLLLAASYPTHRLDQVHPELSDALRTEAEAALRRAEAQLRDAPGRLPPIESRAVAATGPPARVLHELAALERPLLMVIGSSARGQLGRVSPGAVTDRLLHGAPCAVAVAPRGLSLEAAGSAFERVGSAYVDEPDAQAALGVAAAIARRTGAFLRVLVVMRPPDPYPIEVPVAQEFDHDGARREAAESELRHGLGAAGMSASGEVLDGDPPAALAAASADLDLLVCGSRGHGPLHTLLLGGTSHALVRRAACPVLVVPEGAEAELAAAFEARAVAS